MYMHELQHMQKCTLKKKPCTCKMYSLTEDCHTRFKIFKNCKIKLKNDYKFENYEILKQFNTKN